MGRYSELATILKKLKVICFLFDPNIGGPTIRAKLVYQKMMAQGYEIRVAFPKGEGSARSYLRDANVDTDQLSIPKPVAPSKLFQFLSNRNCEMLRLVFALYPLLTDELII